MSDDTGTTTATGTTYYMACNSHDGAVFGPDRATYEQAQADVDAHLQKYPGHDCGVLNSG